jgi:hypothetical protein
MSESQSNQAQDEQSGQTTRTRKYQKTARLPDRFKVLPAKASAVHLVCIRKQRLHVPNHVAEELNIKDIQYAAVGYDPDKSELGVVFYVDDPINDGIITLAAKTIKHSTTGEYMSSDYKKYAFYIDIKQFAEKNDINLPKRSTIFRLHANKGNYYTIDLLTPVKQHVKLSDDEIAVRMAEKKDALQKEIAEQIALRERLTQDNSGAGTLELIQTRERIKKLQRNVHYLTKREEAFAKFKDI